jgi:hypothetical protein
VKLACPCCHCMTLEESSEYGVCPICFWEDDGQSGIDADAVRGGPNAALSLTTARANFVSFGACEARFIANVRAPEPEEVA